MIRFVPFVKRSWSI